MAEVVPALAPAAEVVVAQVAAGAEAVAGVAVVEVDAEVGVAVAAKEKHGTMENQKGEKYMRKNMPRLILIFVVGILYMSPGSMAMAQSCDALVVDESNVLNGHTQEIEQAAQKLVNLGADVRVRTYQTMNGSGNLDTFIKQVEQQCPSWKTPQGRKGNLLVFVHVRQERAAGIFSGLTFKEPIDANYARIIADHMRPHFKQNDFAGAFTAGMEETHRALDMHLHPKQNTTIINAQGVAHALVVITLIVGVLLATWGGSALFRRKSAEREEQKNARKAARQSKEQALLRLTEGTYDIPEEAPAHLQQAKQLFDEAWVLYLEYGPSTIYQQPEQDNLSTREYRELGRIYEVINTKLDEADRLARS